LPLAVGPTMASRGIFETLAPDSDIDDTSVSGEVSSA
jgi:hypothetical protein